MLVTSCVRGIDHMIKRCHNKLLSNTVIIYQIVLFVCNNSHFWDFNSFQHSFPVWFWEYFVLKWTADTVAVDEAPVKSLKRVLASALSAESKYQTVMAYLKQTTTTRPWAPVFSLLQQCDAACKANAGMNLNLGLNHLYFHNVRFLFRYLF